MSSRFGLLYQMVNSDAGKGLDKGVYCHGFNPAKRSSNGGSLSYVLRVRQGVMKHESLKSVVSCYNGSALACDQSSDGSIDITL